MSRLRSTVAIVTLLATVALAGCSDDDPVAQAEPGDADVSTAGATETESESDNSEVDENIAAYFEAYATHSPSAMKEAQSLAAPGSIAEAYMIHQTAAANSAIDSGTPYESGELERTDGGYEICFGNEDSDDSCAKFAKIKADGDKLASFTVQGKDLSKRLIIGDGKKRQVGSLATVELISAYQTGQSNSLWITFWMKAKADGVAIESRTAYQSKDGRQRQHTNAGGPQSLLDGSTGTYTLIYPDTALGGMLHLALFPEEASTPSASVDIPIR